jgi:hypothetical protein
MGEVVLTRYAIAIAGATVALCGVAHAQADTPAERAAVRAETPWFERFTVNNTPQETVGGAGPANRSDAAGWRVNGRWAVTVDVNEARRLGPTPATPQDERSFGAYFQLSPTLRVGGELRVAPGREGAVGAGEEGAQDADVRIQSAFRF